MPYARHDHHKPAFIRFLNDIRICDGPAGLNDRLHACRDLLAGDAEGHQRWAEGGTGEYRRGPEGVAVLVIPRVLPRYRDHPADLVHRAALEVGGLFVAPGGELLGVIEVPENVGNVNWGDDDWKTLYIPASTSVYRIRLKVGGNQLGYMR